MNRITILCISLLILSGCTSPAPNAQPSYERATIEVINGAE